MRRWQAGAKHDFDGITGAIYPGSKFPGDLVWKLEVPCRWGPTHVFVPRFELVFAMADFMAENEDARAQYMDNWRFNGDTYFIRALQRSIKHGWQGPSEQVARQRKRAT